MISNSANELSDLYDKYSAVLYGIALKISPSKKHAEKILIETFRKAYHLKIAAAIYPSPLVKLIKIVVQKAHEYTGAENNNFVIRDFKNTPLLHQILFEGISVQSYCNNNNLTKPEFDEIIREEFNGLRIVQKKKKVF